MFSSVRPSLSAFFLAVLRRAPGAAKLEGARARRACVLLRRVVSAFFLLLSAFWSVPSALYIFVYILCVFVGAIRCLLFSLYILRVFDCARIALGVFLVGLAARLARPSSKARASCCAVLSRRFS